MTRARDIANVTVTPTFPDGSINIADLNIDGGTDIGAALVDADLMVVDDGAGGTNRKATMSRLATYMGGKITGGSMVYLASSGAISSGTASVSFTQFDASKYDHYQFHLQHILGVTNNADLFAHASTDGGSNYDKTDGNYHFNNTDYPGFRVTGDISTATNAAGATGIFYLHAPHSTKYTMGQSKVVAMLSDTYIGAHTASETVHLVNQDTDAIQFAMNTGNIASGEIVMYGIANGT